MIDDILQDVRYAIRALRSSPGFAAVAILSLALGIGANTAIFSLIDSVILKTLPVVHPEQLLQVTMGKNAYFTNPIWEQIRDRQDVFSGVFAYGGGRFNLAAGGEARYAQGNYTSGQFFDTLGLRPLIGRTFTAADDKRGCPGTVVLSHGLLGTGIWWPRGRRREEYLTRQSSLRDCGCARAGFYRHGRRQQRGSLRAPLLREDHSR